MRIKIGEQPKLPPIKPADIKLTESQQKYVQNQDKYSIVLAGAGSGKTTTMIERISHVLETTDVKPHEILSISFTRDASTNMKRKLEGKGHIGVEARTFHAWMKSYVDMKHNKKHSVLGGIDSTLSMYFPTQRRKRISLAYQMSEEKEGFIHDDVKRILRTIFANPYMKEEELLVDHTDEQIDYAYDILDWAKEEMTSFLSFDHIVYEFMQDFLKGKTKNFMNKYKHIYVDEVQDIDMVQYDVLMRFEGNIEHISYIGDIDQMIYGFRTGNRNFMYEMIQDRTKYTIHRLQENFRSNRAIVELANHIISKNTERDERMKMKAVKNEKSRIVFKQAYELPSMLKQMKGKDYKILGRTNDSISGLPNSCTIHKSKGLEWDYIILVDMVDGIFPNSKSTEEEERRLFYVALTRAKKGIIVIDNGYSSFAEEMKEFLESMYIDRNN